MHVPQGGSVPLLVLAEEARELPHLGDFGAVEAEAAGDPGEVVAAVGRVARVAARRAEFVRLGAIAAVIQDADQHLNTVAAEGLQFLDVLVEAAVAVDQQHFVTAARDGDADRCRQPRAERAKIDRHVIFAGGSALEVRHRKAKAVAAGDDDVPIPGDGAVELTQYRPRVQCFRRHREFLVVGHIGGNAWSNRVAAPARPADAAFPEAAWKWSRLWRGRRRGCADRQCATPATAHAGSCRFARPWHWGRDNRP